MKIIVHLFIIFSACLATSCAHKTTAYRTISGGSDESCFTLFKQIAKDYTKSKWQPKNILKIHKAKKKFREKFRNLIDSIKGFESDNFTPFAGRAKMVIDPKEALAAKILAIRNAKYSIDLSYYIFENDEAGKAILDELRRAIRRGVSVRLMVDSVGSFKAAYFSKEILALQRIRGGFLKNSDGTSSFSTRATLSIGVFNPMFRIEARVKNLYRLVTNLLRKQENKIPLIEGNIQRRSHDKILLADAHSPEDSLAIMGGRNISNKYYSLAEEKSNFQDAEIIFKGQIENPTTAFRDQLEYYYNRIYFYAAVSKLRLFFYSLLPLNLRKELNKSRHARNALVKNDGPLVETLTRMESENYLEEGFEDGILQFMHEINNISRRKSRFNPDGILGPPNPNSLLGHLKGSISTAEKTIDIVSPYLWLNDEEIGLLKTWLSVDPTRRVRLITSSIISNDSIPAQALIDHDLAPRIQSAGIDHQFQFLTYGLSDDVSLGGNVEYGLLHAKLVLVDDQKLFNMTSNLDPRSRFLNMEIGISFSPSRSQDSDLIQQAQDFIDELAKKSTLYGSDEWKKVHYDAETSETRDFSFIISRIIKMFKLEGLI